MAAAGIVVLGCGFVGTEVVRRALAAGVPVFATTRDRERAARLVALGVRAHCAPELSPDVVREHVDAGARVLVAFPPDGHTDAVVAPAFAPASRLVYLSSTAVYGEARGRIDEDTPVNPNDDIGRARLEAERIWLGHGATIVRAAGIYGPWRGLHRRLLAGTFRLWRGGSNVVSRIHVGDLAAMAIGLLEAAESVVRGATFVAADDAPVPQIEAIRWLSARLGIPLPEESTGEVAASLRHDRAVDNARIKAALSMRLAFPSYREGFEACLAAEKT
jgi:nucleoside-diphosphate-sugar epimerase